ncbi:hypothetical protein [Undibacterium umbellatum]|uniref:DNA-binding protein n=1 Tax=Undibacterium umbellatum TaxID=2762300 RepID=A0ABR6ZIH3_9BURK|nr:hypothetical protein [Undibacterium umbellatum]MBC3911499.1 hypothetical protein [Undibacterium umbellatum]
MSDREILEKFAAAVAEKVRPAVPLAVDYWDIAHIATILKREPQVVRERMACLPSFPKARRLPTKTGRAQPLYKATEVLAWIESYIEKN